MTDAETRLAWLKARKQYVTASDVAAVMGLDSNKGPGSVMTDKLSTKLDDETIGNIAQVAAGRHAERGVALWFAEDHPLFTVQMWEAGKLLPSPKVAGLAATPDGLIDHGTPLEIKNVGFEQWPNWHEAGQHDAKYKVPEPSLFDCRPALYNARPNAKQTSTINAWRAGLMELKALDLGAPRPPVKYYAQLQCQMHCLSASEGWLSAQIGGTSRLDFCYTIDPVFVELMLEAVREFWVKLEAKKEKLK